MISLRDEAGVSRVTSIQRGPPCNFLGVDFCIWQRVLPFSRLYRGLQASSRYLADPADR
jgi:hypothetical protein